MKALVWHGDQRLALEDRPDPRAGDGEVVLDVQLAGICGSDLHGYRGNPGPRVPPLVLGHEVVGSVGGESYAVYPVIGCGACARCEAGDDNLCASWQLIGLQRAGGFAEQVVLPERALVPLPEGLELRRAVLAEPLACCVGALAPYELGVGSFVSVFGAGPIGLLTTFLAARDGATVRTLDPITSRRDIAALLGASDFEGPGDLAVDAAGFEETWRASIDSVENGGDVVVVGLGAAEGTLPMATLVRRAVSVRGHFAYSRADFSRALEILADEDLDISWLSDARLAEGARAFADLVDRPNEYTKVLLTP
ncbi:MAG: alcohol dehydrogenase catalytic domain-containing protein [Actinobacteria bacterium]|nr:alcohol dehydrogenase catalytic domain-containing protein [Actinomycetota bacterium]